MDVTSPLDGAVVGKVAVSNASDVDAAVARAKASLWSFIRCCCRSTEVNETNPLNSTFFSITIAVVVGTM